MQVNPHGNWLRQNGLSIYRFYHTGVYISSLICPERGLIRAWERLGVPGSYWYVPYPFQFTVPSGKWRCFVFATFFLWKPTLDHSYQLSTPLCISERFTTTTTTATTTITTYNNINNKNNNDNKEDKNERGRGDKYTLLLVPRRMRSLWNCKYLPCWVWSSVLSEILSIWMTNFLTNH